MPEMQQPIRASERKAARELVESIAADHGYISEDVYKEMSERARQKVQEALKKKDEKIATSIITLAKNLYSSSARFVFELLQNADDNSYSKARRRGKLPFAHFHVFPSQIILDCNEDGFEKKNLDAICNIGKSSKTGAQGYIGEKGIGFKSVFIVSKKVHIQSGDFSFSFNHGKNDSGMGMITPVWEEKFEDLEHPLTRITLQLHKTGDIHEAELEKQRATTAQQFQELQGTFLLFMKNLKKLQIDIYDDAGSMVSETIYKLEHEEDGRTSIRNEIVKDGKSNRSINYYHIVRHTATNLPRSEYRDYSENEEKTRAYAKADIVLAFPLTKDSYPVIERQDIFAFLPVKRMGFHFIVHTDFVTQANRQDIVSSSTRNEKLMDGIADAFIEAAIDFSKHPKLRYLWLKYLPQSKDSIWETNPVWKKYFFASLKENLKQQKIFYGRWKEPERILEVRRLKNDMLDSSGRPLVRDFSDPIYISPQYSAKDLDRLAEYGLNYLSTIECIIKVSKALDREFDDISAKLYSTDKDSEVWKSKLARILSYAFTNSDGAQYRGRVKAMRIIPLKSGRVVSIAEKGSIFYASINGIDLPGDLGLHLVHPAASENCDFKILLDHLGVKELSPLTARDLIKEKYRTDSLARAQADIDVSLGHLRFLYLTDYLDSREGFYLRKPNVWILDHQNRMQNPAIVSIYIQDEKSYGPWELFRPIISGEGRATEVEGFNASFIHSNYLSRGPERPEVKNLPWLHWLKKVLPIEEKLYLTSPDKSSLSQGCIYIAKRRPEKFMGFLRKYWEVDGAAILSNSKLLSELQRVKVLCADGSLEELQNTYLPAKQLLQKTMRFMEEDDFFPWIKLEEAYGDDAILQMEWESLTKALKFGYPRSETDFYVDIFKWIRDGSEGCASLIRQPLRVYQLYEIIQVSYRDECKSSSKELREKMGKRITNIFEEDESILFPAHGQNETQWVWDEICLWDAPADMETRHPLMPALESYLGKGNLFTNLEEFFRNTLSIGNANAVHIIGELRYLRNSDCTDFDRICNLYKLISAKVTAETWDVKDEFEKDALIYIKTGETINWLKVSECIWSTATKIRGMVGLNDTYGKLKDFFVKYLGVKLLDTRMLINKLKEQGKSQSPDIKDIKRTITMLSDMLPSAKVKHDPKPTLDSCIFPVKYPDGIVKLHSCNTDFAIADRKHLYAHFSGSAKILDFAPDEIHRLEPFLSWAGLENRYLSNTVKEISTLRNGTITLVSDTRRQISPMAHGLLRVATHFKSPRSGDSQSLFKLLRSTKVYETDDIFSELHLNQGGEDIKVVLEKSELHIQENDGSLRIYVPKDEEAQELCFCDRLPKALLERIMTEPSTEICTRVTERALTVMQKIFSLSNPSFIEKVLDRSGIFSVDMPSIEMDEDEDTDEAETVINEDAEIDSNVTEYTSMANKRHPNSSLDTFTEDIRQALPQITPTRPTPLQTFPTTIAVPRREPLFEAQNAAELSTHTANNVPGYRSLLDRLIVAARSAKIPHQSSSINTASNGVFLFGSGASARFDFDPTISKLERDKMVGAAGELFVFELLSRLEPKLPNFGRENWKSNIRNYVTVHPKYNDMNPWDGREIADIMYDDPQGTLTSHFIEKGYLDANEWGGKRPNYLLEVKATTSACETAFFVSNSQYLRMKNCKRDNAIYVIFRVFNLDKDTVNFKIYMDPERLRQEEELIFTADTWSVRPKFSLDP